MCTRIDAIRFVITNKFGYKNELKDKIKEYYDSFVITGLIYEPAGAPSFENSQTIERGIAREWIATPEAFQRARLLNIKPNDDFLLESNPMKKSRRRYRRANSRIGHVLHEVLDVFGIF